MDEGPATGQDRTREVDETAPDQRGAELRTFLIADIRGYTTYTAEHGDEAAAQLARRFATLVEDVVKTREGFLLELRGDEALAVFVSARQALRAANEIQRRIEIETLPRGVGIGLDAGEAIPVGGGFRGSALNLAARLCSQAAAGQIIASETVIHLAARVDGLAYVDARTLRLKGLDQPVRAVTVVPQDRADRGRRRVRRMPPIQHPWLLAGAGGALAVAVVAVALFAATRSPAGPDGSARPTLVPPSATPTPSLVAGAKNISAESLPVVAFLDQSNGAVLGTVEGFGNPVDAVFGEGAFWVLDLQPRAIWRVDPATQAATPVISLGFRPSSFTVAEGRVWIAEAAPGAIIHEFDALSGTELEEFSISANSSFYEGVEGLAYGDGALWAAYGWPGDVARIDPSTREHVRSISTGAISGLRFADGSLWTFNGWLGEVVRIDTSTDKVVERTSVGEGVSGLAAGAGRAWLMRAGESTVTSVDERGETEAHAVGGPVKSIAFDPTTDIVWTGNSSAGSVSRIDPVTGDVQTFVLGHAIGPVVADAGVVLAGVRLGPDAIVAGIEGSVMKAAAIESFSATDPATWVPTLGFAEDSRLQLEQATCLRLLDYPDSGGAEGATLAPSAAASMPDVSADGRTYAFTVRPGFAFSPPSGQPVTAETYRYSIERALSPALGGDDIAPGYLHLSDIRGASAFHDGQTERLEGLRVEGDRLVIQLVRPSPTFLERLWLPWFCPVPTGTAAVVGGISDPPIPRAGPYYIAEHFNGEVLILRRNPNYPGSRKPTFDAIAWYHEPNLGRAIARLERGELDYMAGLGEPLAAGGRLDQQWGPGSEAAAAGNQRVFRLPLYGVDYLAVNPGSEALADPAVRRAVALAMDRTLLASSFGMPTDEFLPLVMPGLVDRDRFPLDGAKPDEARALLAGRNVRLRLAWPSATSCPQCPAVADRLAQQLTAAGIGLTVEEFDDPAQFASGTDSGFDLAAAFTWTVVPDPATWLGRAFSGERFSGSPPSGWFPDWARAELSRIEGLPATEQDAAAGALADRMATELIVIPYSNASASQIVSERLGCLTFQPRAPMLDLVAACLK